MNEMRAIDLLGGTEVIPENECRQLLAAGRVGRVGVVVADEVDIFPVNYHLDRDRIVFATNQGRKFLGLQTGEATFEIDSFDETARAGWSVIVHGFLESAQTLAGDAAHPQSWTGPKDHLVRIRPAAISGRRVVGSFWPDRLP